LHSDPQSVGDNAKKCKNCFFDTPHCTLTPRWKGEIIIFSSTWVGNDF